ncbi:MAG: hypothetical protein V3W20_06500 [Candidatus Neomarinimicrobiota bacterium]
MNKLILVDVDGVVLQWGWAFGAYIKNMGLVPEDHLVRPAYKVEKILDITRDEATDLIAEFHASDHFKHLEPYDDALHYVHKLADKGYKFVAISAAYQNGTNEAKIYNNRYENLEKHYPDIFDDLHLVQMRASKDRFLKLYSNAYWVEDTLTNAITGIDVGHTSFFLDREEDPRNQGSHPDVITVKGWEEIYDYIG